MKVMDVEDDDDHDDDDDESDDDDDDSGEEKTGVCSRAFWFCFVLFVLFALM